METEPSIGCVLGYDIVQEERQNMTKLQKDHTEKRMDMKDQYHNTTSKLQTPCQTQPACKHHRISFSIGYHEVTPIA